MTHAASIDTPAAVVDVDRLERNLARWQAECDRVGLANRPHVKTHRCAEIARRQLAHGAAGLTCQKLGEAEAMVDAGLDDVLVAYNLLGEAKLERLAALVERATVAVAVDDEALLDGLAGAAAQAGRPLGVLVDCDTGLGRTGVQSPDAAAALAVEVARRPGLELRGFLTHPSPPGARDFLERAVEEAAREGLEAGSVSAGGTPAMWDCESLRPIVTEYRAGTYAFHDRATLAAGACSEDDLALTVHATVVSRPTGDRALLDAGSKVLGSEPARDGTFGAVLETRGSVVARVDEEHAYVTLGPDDRLELGDRVRIAPNHACLVPNLFEELVVVSGEQVVDRWRVDARGRSA